jgi:hypothetical protein
VPAESLSPDLYLRPPLYDLPVPVSWFVLITIIPCSKRLQTSKVLQRGFLGIHFCFTKH